MSKVLHKFSVKGVLGTVKFLMSNREGLFFFTRLHVLFICFDKSALNLFCFY